MCARTDFERDCPEMYGMLLKEHDIPPRRTLVTLGDDEILTHHQPTTVGKALISQAFPFTPEGVNQALNYLRGRRMSADLAFDGSGEECPAATLIPIS